MLAPEYVKVTVGSVPVTVKFVVVLSAQAVVPVPKSVIDPVPKARVRVLALLEEKLPVVSKLVLRLRVPFVRVVVIVEGCVKAS